MKKLLLGRMFFSLLGVQQGVLPVLATAMNCCPCWNPCGGPCVCRGTSGHCPVCKESESQTFGVPAGALAESRMASASHTVALVRAEVADFAEELSDLIRAGKPTISDQASRFLGKPEFRFVFWCPQANQDEEDGTLRAALTPVIGRG